MSLLSVLFHLQNCVSVFEILIFSQDIWKSVHYVLEINLISYGTLIKAFYLPSKTIQKKFETRFCRRKATKDNNAKIKVFPSMSFCCSELVDFFKFSFREIYFLRTSVFLNSKCLKTSNKRTPIPLSINQFVSLI